MLNCRRRASCGLDPYAAELREKLAEIAAQGEESLGVVAEDVVEQRRQAKPVGVHPKLPRRVNRGGHRHQLGVEAIQARGPELLGDRIEMVPLATWLQIAPASNPRPPLGIVHGIGCGSPFLDHSSILRHDRPFAEFDFKVVGDRRAILSFRRPETDLELDYGFLLACEHQFATLPIAGECLGERFLRAPREGKHCLEKTRLSRVVLTDDDMDRREREPHVDQTFIIIYIYFFDHFNSAFGGGGVLVSI